MDAPTQSLVELGWRAFFSAQTSEDEDRHCQPVRVMAVLRGKIAVAGAGFAQQIDPHLPGVRAAEDHPTVGDWLLIDRETQRPMRILDRAKPLQEKGAGTQPPVADNRRKCGHIVRCRILQPGLQHGATGTLSYPRTRGRREPRRGSHQGGPDRYPEAFETAARNLQSDLLVRGVNARDPDSVASLASWCGMGETVALLGSSGVGKSTLVNSLRGSDSIATQEIRKADGTGRHTTTVREMHRLDRGGWLLDTPGMRELQLTDAAAGLAEVFDDITAAIEQCRFSNCAHSDRTRLRRSGRPCPGRIVRGTPGPLAQARGGGTA